MIWGAFGAPHKGPQKNFRKEKSKVKNLKSLATALHIHGASHAGGQPKAKTSQMGSNRDTSFSKEKSHKNQIRNRKSQKHSPNTGTETYKQAGEESCRQFEAKQQMSRAASQAGSQEAKQPGRSAHAGSQASNQQRRDKKRANKATNQRASQHASQAARTPPSQPANQAASQPDTSKNNQNRKGREAHRNSNTHSQAGALLAQLLGDTTSLPERESNAKPLGSQCKPCLRETKHDQKQ